MTYRAPRRRHRALRSNTPPALQPRIDEGLFGDLDQDDVDAVLEEAGRFAAEVIAPLNRVGDTYGTPFKDGAVTTPPGWKEAYKAWCDGGWNGLAAPAEWGGQALPQSLSMPPAVEMWNSASMAFGVGPLLTMAAIDALHAHGTDDAQADLSGKARRPANGRAPCSSPSRRPAPMSARCARAPSARATAPIASPGQKIFITYGEHDLTDNIIHFVLARLPDAPPGTRGISLFLVPKFLLNADGSLGARNDVRAHSVEHKLGIHGSPTCTMMLGDHGGAIGLPDRRGKCRHGLHVHHDEPRAARGRPAGRRHRRARHAAGARLCARAQAGPHAGHAGDRIGADHRPPRRQAHAADACAR